MVLMQSIRIAKEENKMENKTQEKKQANNLPEQRFKAGAITATVWKNDVIKDGDNASFNSITIERSYKDKDGNWQTTHSFRTNDLPRLALVAQKAFDYVVSSSQSA
jgi:hypothetical protein